MSNEPKQLTDIEMLVKIENHLKSIKGAVQFFVFLAIMAILLQACSALLSI